LAPLRAPRLQFRFPWYQRLVRPLLFRLPPERAQRVAESFLAVRPAWRAVGGAWRMKDRLLRRTVAGIDLDNPIGLAAGFDKQCQYLESLGHLGFGYLVGGTVTPDPRPGNPRPRLLREQATQSLVNSMGFPSDGLQVVAERLRRRRRRPVPLVVSIAALDVAGFQECHQKLEPLADAIELNISSPNTQGLRRFQNPEQLSELLGHINAQRHKPLFLKLPPYTDDQSREQVFSLLHQCLTGGVTGVTAINTIPVTDPRLATGQGGLSGKVIFPDMLRIVGELRREAGPDLVINACGGISTGTEAWQALQAGADTVQLFTAMVYQGPAVARAIALELAARLRAQQADAALNVS